MQLDTYSKRKIDATLPSRWNVIKKKKTKRSDPMSHDLFGTIRCGSFTSKKQSARGYSQDLPENIQSTKSVQQPTKRQKNMITARNKHYIDNYNFTNFIVNDTEPIPMGNLTHYQTKESRIINSNILHIANVDSDDDNDNEDISIHDKLSEDVGHGNIDDDDDYEMNVDPDQIYTYYEDINTEDEDNDEKADEEMNEYQSSGWLNQEEKEERFPGWIHLDEIRKYQETTKLLIPKEEFDSFVGNVICNDNRYSNDVKFQLSAMLNLQEATEAFLIELFEYANLCAIHGDREAVNDEDIKTAIKLWMGKDKTEWGYHTKYDHKG